MIYKSTKAKLIHDSGRIYFILFGLLCFVFVRNSEQEDLRRRFEMAWTSVSVIGSGAWLGLQLKLNVIGS